MGTNLIAPASHLTMNGTFNLGQAQSAAQSLAGLSGNGEINMGEGSTLALNLTQSGMFNGIISGPGNVTLNATPNTSVETWTTTQNYFEGSVTLNGGILSVGAIAALGEEPDLILNGGTFRYTGSTGGTSSFIQLGTNGGTLDASGTGALNLSGQFYSQGGTPSLTLTGTSAAGNIISGGITGITSLTKSGLGLWIFAGFGPYSPTSTQISSGTLEIENGGNTGGSSITLGGGGNLEVSQQSASFAVASGKVFSASGGSVILNNIPSVAVGTLTRPAGGGMVIVPTSSTALSSTESMGVLAGLPTVNGIVDASLVAQNSVADSTGDFLSYNNSTGFVRATYPAVTSITNGSGGTSATSVFHATMTTNNTVTSASRIYALKVDSGVTINGTTLTLGDGAHTAGLIINSNSVSSPTQISAPIAFGSSEGAVYVGGNVAGAPSGPYASMTGQVSGTAGLTKSGNGILELPTAFYTGTTTINQGTLQFDNTGPAGIGSTSLINLAGTVLYNSVPSVTATFNLLSDAATIGAGPNSAVSIQGTINGNGHALNVGGPNDGSVLLGGTESNVLQYNVVSSTLQVAGSLGGGTAPIAVAFSGTEAMATLEIKSGSTLSNPIILGNGLLQSDGSSTVTGVLTLASPTGTIDPASGTLTLAGPVEGTAPLTINGAGSVALSGGANTYTGLTQVAQGTLNVAGAITNTSQVIIGSNATLNFTSGSLTTTGTISNNGTMVLGSGVTVSSSGAFTNYGTLDLRSDPSFTLPSNFVNEGTILYANVPATDTPTMPVWALIATGGLLFALASVTLRKPFPSR
jgi:fibronectin-binding autotransporter adhesin